MNQNFFIEPTITRKRSPPKYKSKLKFLSKAFDFINLSKILRSQQSINTFPTEVNKTDIPMVIYSLNQPIGSKIFNYNTIIMWLDLNEFVNNDSSIPCFCNEFNRCYIENDFGHIISGDLGIVNNEKLKNILSKGPKYRAPAEINWTKAREEIKSALNEFLEIISNDKGLDKSHFSEWLSTILSQVDNKITTLNNKIKTKHIKSVFKDQGVKNQLILLKEKFVIVPIDKATNNIAFICKHFYAKILVKEFSFPNTVRNYDTTYHRIHNLNKDQIIQNHKTYLKQLNNMELKEDMKSLPCMYWIPKIHKNPIGF